MPAISARNLLRSSGVLSDVDVLNVKQLDVGQAVLSFVMNGLRYDDIYQVPEGLMDVLLSVPAGRKVLASLAPDSTEDDNSFPKVLEARIAE